MPGELIAMFGALAVPVCGVVLFGLAARWLWRAGSKPTVAPPAQAPPLAAGEEARQLVAELESARLRVEELERRLERVDDRSAFVEKLLEKPGERP